MRSFFRQGITSKRLWRVVAGRAALVVIIILILAWVAPRTSFIEVRALDLLFALRPARQPDSRVEIIDIGPSSDIYERLRVPGDSSSEGCETPRLVYAEAVNRLSRWGAKVIIFDVMFRRSCKFEDQQLAEAFRRAGNVIVAANTKTTPGAIGLQDPVSPIDKAVWAVGSPVAHQPNAAVRSVPLMVRDRDTGKEYLALSLIAFQHFNGLEPNEFVIREGRWLETAGLRAPILSGEKIYLFNFGETSRGSSPSSDSSSVIEVVSGSNVKEIPKLKKWNTLIVNWVGHQGAIRPRQLSEVLAIEDDTKGRELFEGKAIIIGQMDWDVHWTAIGAMPGPEIHANALNTFISGKFIRPITSRNMLGMLVIFSLLTAVAVRRFKGIRAIGATLVIMGAAAVIAWQLLVKNGIWMYLFFSELGIVLTLVMTTAMESDKVTNMLGRFIPAFIGKPEPTLTREVRSMEASILFSDIRGYTSTAEQLSAVDTMNMLNTYHSSVEDIIAKYGGTIVKTPGDAILAVFWKDVRDFNHATCALRSGQEIIQDVPRMAKAWEAAGVKLKVGVGINSGEVAMGLVGKRHLEPTVIGDPVNVAQRLESLTKTLEYPLIFSESVREKLGEDLDAIYLDEVTVSGRKVPLKIYSIAEFKEFGQKTTDTADKETTE